MTTTSRTPRDVALAVIDGITAGRWDDLPDLYAEGAVVTHPFALPEPTRIEGRAEVRKHLDQARQFNFDMTARDIVTHEGAEPDVVVIEWTYDFTTSDGTVISLPNVIVMRVRDGQIIESHDYHNHAALAESLLRP